ncbi:MULTISPECIES: helicase-related protein [unclassified Pseudoalteromonas]|uniref:helicase-related protein n=1 Tax=unclassified Pseudoalteromonas TaxID=194690 RepID=UPI0023588247|nr:MULTISPECIES: helicase-related protein [unclassified Pseudoalteromonas]MDC9563411.1 helicase-related protein [Pseudoalteromonas sp. GAB2316C]MDC9572107.1 helicase-related protein [Pseudoalteromonas sp. GABNS16A]MDC9583858.1 helicase-related protein [Pseudoalteromonas sp. GABNS16C]MDC9607746.1 helicase-related protein [Pseudoalteromonas sp. GABNS16H]
MTNIDIFTKHPALYLPTSLEDNTEVVDNLMNLKACVGHEIIVYGTVTRKGTHTTRRNVRFSSYEIKDTLTFATFVLFGDINDRVTEDNQPQYIKGIIELENGLLKINKASIVDENKAGKLVPIYSGVKGKLKKADVNHAMLTLDLNSEIEKGTELIHKELERIFGPIYISILEKLGFVGCTSIANLFKSCHKPSQVNEFYRSLEMLKRLSSALMAGAILKERIVSPVSAAKASSKINNELLTKYVPFTLTGEQFYVCNKINDRLANGGNALDGLLIGDVGTGKTVILAMAARQVLLSQSNSKVIFLAPNVSLCEQLRKEVTAMIPEVQSALVCADKNSYSASARLIFGTTALLNMQFDNVELLIIDEQQQLSVKQRRLIKSTHYLEASATPIPRSMALAKYSSENVFFLKQQHLPKEIYTRVVHKEQGTELMHSIKETLSFGCKVLIVCPKRDGDGKANKMIDAESLANSLNSYFPGLVRVYHSALDEEECETVLNEFKTHIPILISTSKIQVGLTIPDLRHCIVYGAERFGLTTLHQIRGRLARTPPPYGINWGKFDLFLPNKPSETTEQRLNVLTQSCDGFYISEKDLELRGAGELLRTGNKQHGTTDSLIKNISIDLDRLTAAIQYLEAFMKEMEQPQVMAS